MATIKHSVFPVAFVLSVALTGILLFFFGYFYETYEVFTADITAASFCDPPKDLWFTTTHLFLYPLYAQIQQWAPAFPAVGFLGLTLTFFMVVAGYYYLLSVLNDKGVPLLPGIALSTIVILILFSDSIIQFSSTRLSILITALVLLSLLRASGRNTYILCLLLLVFGCLMRIQTAFIATFFVLLALLVFRLPIRQNLRKLVTAMAILLVLLSAYQTDRKTTHNFGKVIEDRYEYAIEDRRDLVPLSEMKTKVDTLRYLAAQQLMLNDSTQFTRASIDRVVAHHSLSEQLTDQKYFVERFKLAVVTVMSFCQRFAFKLVFILLLFVSGVCLSFDKRKSLLQHLSIVVLLFVLLTGLALVAYMVDRIFSPLLTVAALCQVHLIVITELGTNRRQNIFAGLLLVMSLILLAPLTSFLTTTSNSNTEKNKVYYSLTENLADHSKGKYIVMLGLDDQIFNNKVFAQRDKELLSRLILPDASYMDYYAFLKDRYQRLYGFNATDAGSVGNFLLKNREGIVIYSRENRALLLQDYLQGIYHLPVRFVPQGPAMSYSSDKWFYYKAEMSTPSVK